MKKILAIYKGNVCEIYEDSWHYYFTNSKWVKTEVQKNDFIFIW